MKKKKTFENKIMDSVFFLTSVIPIKGWDGRIRLAFHSFLEIYTI